MKLIQDLGIEKNVKTGIKRRYGIYECSVCKVHFKTCSYYVKHKNIQSCRRCSSIKNATTHGYKHTKLYNVLMQMKQRCTNHNFKQFKDYGGRGITVCKKWSTDHASFVEWSLSNGYEEGLEIDRIDNDKGYSPDNCRWVTSKENNNNKRKNVLGVIG